MAHDFHGVYRGVYEWDWPVMAENYARTVRRVLALRPPLTVRSIGPARGVGNSAASMDPSRQLTVQRFRGPTRTRSHLPWQEPTSATAGCYGLGAEDHL